MTEKDEIEAVEEGLESDHQATAETMSYLALLGQRYRLRTGTLGVALTTALDGSPRAEMDLYVEGETAGADACGLVLDSLELDSVSQLGDIDGRVLIEPPPELLSIGSLDRPGLSVEARADESAFVSGESAPLRDLNGEEGQDPELLVEDDDPMLTEFERSVLVPGLELDVARVRVAFGRLHRRRVRVTVDIEADAIGADGKVERREVPVRAEFVVEVERVG